MKHWPAWSRVMLYLTTHLEAFTVPENPPKVKGTESSTRRGGHGRLYTDSRGWLEGRERQTSNPDGLWYGLWTGPLSSNGWWQERNGEGWWGEGEGEGKARKRPGEFLKWIYLYHDQRKAERKEKRESDWGTVCASFFFFFSRSRS